MLIDVSPGEFLDRMYILNLKAERFVDPNKRRWALRKLAAMRSTWSKCRYSRDIEEPNLRGAVANLYEIHRDLWDLENKVRSTTNVEPYTAERIFKLNNARARLKTSIDERLGCDGEPKEHS